MLRGRGLGSFVACALFGATLAWGALPVAEVHAAAVSGVVTDSATTTGLAGASVRMTLNGASTPLSITVLTGSLGEWTIDVPIDGTYSLFISKPNYQPTSDVVVVPTGGTLAHTLTATPLANVSGRVTDGTSGIQATITPYSGGIFGFTPLPAVATNADGTFSLDLAPNAQWRLVASAPGMIDNAFFTGTVTAPLSFGDVVLTRLAVLKGTVRGSNGQPLPGVTVRVTTSMMPLPDLTTDANGFYSTSVVPGNYSLNFSLPTYLSQCWPTPTVPPPPFSNPCPPRNLAPGSTTTVDVVLVKPGSISGATTAGGAPVQAFVAVVSRSGVTSFANAMGTYTLSNLAPGTYYVAALPGAPGSPYGAEWHGGSTSMAGSQPVVVAEGATRSGTDIDFDIGFPGTVSFTTAAATAAGPGHGYAVCGGSARATSRQGVCSDGSPTFASGNTASPSTLSIRPMRPGGYTLTHVTIGPFTPFGPVLTPVASVPLAVVAAPFTCTVVVDGPGTTCNSPDDDGVTDATEDAHPNGGDGNGDRTVDSAQAHVSSLPAAEGGGWVTVASSAGSLAAVSVAPLPGGSPPGTSVVGPGLVGYTVDGLLPGAAADVTIHLTTPTDATGYAKYVNAMWQPLPAGAFTIAGNRLSITLHLVDGGVGDADRAANGVIVDPGAPTAPAATVLYDIEWLLPTDRTALLSAKAKQTTGFAVRVMSGGVPVEAPGTVTAPTSVLTPCPSKKAAVALPGTNNIAPATVHIGDGVWIAGWVPAKEWRGTCRLVTIVFGDGTSQMLTVKVT